MTVLLLTSEATSEAKQAITSPTSLLPYDPIDVRGDARGQTGLLT